MHSKQIRPGFSLVELLVVIGVVAILLSLVLPALRGARRSAAELVSLSNARQLAMVIQMYSDASGGLLPATEDGRFYPEIDESSSFSYPYWQVYQTWTGVVFPVLPYGDAIDVYISPLARRTDIGHATWPSSYHYSTSFAGQPALWKPGAVADASLRRGVRSHQIRFPSSKALLWDSEVDAGRAQARDPDGNLITVTPIASADGSGAFRVPAEAAVAVPNPYGNGVSRLRMHNTPEGVSGRDF